MLTIAHRLGRLRQLSSRYRAALRARQRQCLHGSADWVARLLERRPLLHTHCVVLAGSGPVGSKWWLCVCARTAADALAICHIPIARLSQASASQPQRNTPAHIRNSQQQLASHRTPKTFRGQIHQTRPPTPRRELCVLCVQVVERARWHARRFRDPARRDRSSDGLQVRAMILPPLATPPVRSPLSVRYARVRPSVATARNGTIASCAD